MVKFLKLGCFLILPLLSFGQKDSINEVLLQAAFEGDQHKVILALKDSADINTKSYEGLTPLMYASLNGYIGIVKILLHNGADIKPETKLKENAFQLASVNGHVDVANELIQYGTDFNKTDRSGNTSLMYASRYGYYYLADMLLFYGANKYLQNNDGRTALHIACGYGALAIVSLFIKDTTNLDLPDKFGYTPLMTAIKNNRRQVVDTLIAHGVNLDYVNKNRHNALNLAIMLDQYDVVKLLIEKGAVINLDGLSENPVDLARQMENYQLIRLLKKKGAKGSFSVNLNVIHLNYTFNTSFHEKLYYTGIGLYDPRNRFSVDVDFGMRYAREAVLKEYEDPVYFQVMEQRYVVDAGATKYFVLHYNGFQTLNCYVTAKLAYSWGNYTGFREKLEGSFDFQPALGLLYKGRIMGLSVGYQYADYGLYDIPVSRFQTGLHFYINTVKYK